MFKFVTIAVVIYLAGSGIAQESNESDGPPERENVFAKVFPACKEFVVAFESKAVEMFKNDEIGPNSCPDEEYYDGDCIKDDAIETRCALNEMPSEECIAQMTAFIRGGACNLRRK